MNNTVILGRGRGARSLKFIASFLLPIVIFLIFCICEQIVPFGDNSLLISDMSNQYVDFFSYLKSILLGENDFFYTFSKSMGGDAVGFSAYYLLSPLNLLFLFFSQEQFPFCITLLYSLKIGLCGLTSAVFLENKGNSASWSVLLFSTSYALMGYNCMYCFNIMWLDGVYALPLIALGIEHILKDGKGTIYIISLAYALLTNYYIGYMLCIFSLIYYAYCAAVMYTDKEGLCKGHFLRFGTCSLMAGGISAIVLLPTFLSLSGTKAGVDWSKFTFRTNFEIKEILLKLFTGTISRDEMVDGLPNVFCGILVVLLAIFYFLNASIKLKNKLAAGVILSVLLISFQLNPVNLIWHGFSPPSWFPYRYSFVFSFILILLAYQSFQHITFISKKQFLYAPLVIVAIVALLPTTDTEFLTSSGIYLDILCVILLDVALYLLAYRVDVRRRGIVILSVMCCSNLLLNMCSIVALNGYMIKADSFTQYVQNTSPAIEWVKESDDSFYRMEKLFSRSKNDAMQFNYAGISHFCSTEKTATKYYVGDWGYIKYWNMWRAYHQDSTITADTFFGIKYLLAKENTDKLEFYSYLHTENDISIYENPWVLPMAFPVSSSILSAEIQNYDIFLRQNQIFSAMIDENAGIFNKAMVQEVSVENLLCTQSEADCTFTKENKSGDAYINYKVKCLNDDLLYMDIPKIAGKNTPKVEVYIEDEPLKASLTNAQRFVVCLGRYHADEIVNVRLKIVADSITLGDPLFYHESVAELEKCVNQLRGTGEVERISSSHLVWNGAVTEEQPILLFSIPNEAGWHVSVDGDAVEPATAIGCVIAVELEPGAHTVELRFIPRGFLAGTAISLGTLVMFAGLLYLQKKRDKGEIIRVGQKKK